MSPAQSTGTWSASTGIIASSSWAKASLVRANGSMVTPLAVKQRALKPGSLSLSVTSWSSLGELGGDVVAAFVDGDEGVDVEQVGQDLVVGLLVVQAAGAVDPDPGDGQVAAVEPLQGDLDGFHRGAAGCRWRS